MKARITRTGGFAGISQSREVHLTHEQVRKLRDKCAEPLQPVRDGFSYEVTVDGETFDVSDEVLEELLR